ncbi:hypothetical protein F4V44_14175 [Niallia endozanthoxylica]|uniref:Uncharacterized protein n=1 Tax=Niallia endozanthoxylica TaxID=2036016 RepID=A0A5J5HS82_9BACI|nr:hypothetical protein F4V44_14175 [Niallia endozanthoxylica]
MIIFDEAQRAWDAKKMKGPKAKVSGNTIQYLVSLCVKSH